MAYYPVLAELKYKNNHVDVDLKIRIKLFEIPMWLCKKCNLSGTLKDMNWYHENHNKGSTKFTTYYPKYKTSVYDELMDGDKPLCPKCKKRVVPHPEKMIKVYLPTVFPEVNCKYLLERFTVLRWRESFIQGRYTLAAYKKKLKDVYDGLGLAKEYAKGKKSAFKLKKSESLSVKINKVLMRDLLADLEKYNERMVARKI